MGGLGLITKKKATQATERWLTLAFSFFIKINAILVDETPVKAPVFDATQARLKGHLFGLASSLQSPSPCVLRFSQGKRPRG